MQASHLNLKKKRKNAFLGYKSKTLKKIFPKRLVHGFGQKLAIFPSFLIGNIGEEYVLYYILEQQKNAFLGYKNKKFKKGLLQCYAKVVSKNWLFFHLFFFRQYRPGKCSLLYSRAKNAFLGYKNKRFKKSKY